MGKFKDLFKKKRKGFFCAALTITLAAGIVFWQMPSMYTLPEVAVDPIMETVELEEEEAPLAAPIVRTTTKTSTATGRRTVAMSYAASKTYTKALPTKTAKTTKTTRSSNKTVKTVTVKKTATTEKYTRKSKKKLVTTKVTTTVTTTTTTIPATTASGTTTQTAQKIYQVDVAKVAPKMNAKVLKAFKDLGFKVTINPTVSYSGLMDAKEQSITLKAENDVVYHELGHFLAFVAGNYDLSSAFSSVYAKEKSLYTAYNKAYVTKSASEYFAESVKDYILNPSALKTQRPQTYAAIQTALNKVTDAQIAKYKIVFAAYWK